MTAAVAMLHDAGDAEIYLRGQGLDAVLTPPASGVLPPDLDDLVRLHRLVRARRVFTALEFGVGYSTLVLADALAQNEAEFAAAGAAFAPPADAFRLFSVDTGAAWISRTAERLPDRLRGRVTFSHSVARAGIFADQLCHFYDRVPDVTPDFVYIDGPDPQAVEGDVGGIGFSHPERTPLAADLLRLEPVMLPGLMILIDGRVNNARFLQRNFRRDFAVYEDPRSHFTTLELVEAPLGARNRQRLDYCLGDGR